MFRKILACHNYLRRKNGNGTFFLEAAVTRAGKYYKLNTFTAVLSSNFNVCLKGFSERCISEFQQKYKVSVKFLIFDVEDAEENTFIKE